MPLGFERLNERTQRPNACINFIKPLANATPEDQAIAKNFLERIAAQCYPVMKRDYLSVMALEEYAPNPEFLGRNFNAGEVIQLVLKDKSGRWLSFRFVQMVMMHELAHCKQMNHSRFFWKERNRFAAHMEELWAVGYKGEGAWGCGQDLASGSLVPDRMPEGASIPEHLCGGTYRRSRGRKRKRGQDSENKPKLSYAERQQKRIAKKFGVHGGGHALEEDELVRGALEQGKRHQGKPRVAKSKRGRELRANAALARFEAAKSQAPEKTPELDDDLGSETESDDEPNDYADGLDIFNTLEKIKDQRGRELYKVCGDEGEQEDGGKDELEDLRRMGLEGGPPKKKVHTHEPPKGQRHQPAEESETESEAADDLDVLPKPVRGSAKAPTKQLPDDSETESELEPTLNEPEELNNSAKAGQQAIQRTEKSSTQSPDTPLQLGSTTAAHDYEKLATVPSRAAPSFSACPICSLENEPDSPTCIACSHVLKLSLVRNHWRCRGEQCKGSAYVNAGDAGRCGICGALRPVMETAAIGVIGGDVLRWD